MTRLILCLIAALAAVPAVAQVKDDFNEELGLPYGAPGRGETDHDALRRRSLAVLETQYGAFSQATDELTTAAIAYCDQGASKDTYEQAFRDAWLSWAPLDSYQFGPVENNGAALAVNFWPDKKNFVGRALRDLLSRSDAAQRDPEEIAAGSAAVQGFPAIEMLLYTDAPDCPAIIGISSHLNMVADTLYHDWFDADGWADLARAAGPDNPVYLSPQEFTKTLYTAVDFGLIRVADQRLGRPLGTYDRSFPTRAEAWRSGLTSDIIDAQLDGVADMIQDGFAGDIREPDRAWVLRLIQQTRARIDKVGLPISEAVKDPQTRIRVEALRSKVDQIRQAIAEDVGPGLGVNTGFSPADGD